jgi:hypothetical protein
MAKIKVLFAFIDKRHINCRQCLKDTSMKKSLTIALITLSTLLSGQSVFDYQFKKSDSIQTTQLKAISSTTIMSAAGNFSWQDFQMIRPYFQPSDQFLQIAGTVSGLKIDTAEFHHLVQPSTVLALDKDQLLPSDPFQTGRSANIKTKIGLLSFSGIAIATGLIIGSQDIDQTGKTADQVLVQLNNRRKITQILYGVAGGASVVSLLIPIH